MGRTDARSADDQQVARRYFFYAYLLTVLTSTTALLATWTLLPDERYGTVALLMILAGVHGAGIGLALVFDWRKMRRYLRAVQRSYRRKWNAQVWRYICFDLSRTSMLAWAWVLVGFSSCWFLYAAIVLSWA